MVCEKVKGNLTKHPFSYAGLGGSIRLSCPSTYTYQGGDENEHPSAGWRVYKMVSACFLLFYFVFSYRDGYS